MIGNRFLFNSATSSYENAAEPSYLSAHSSSTGQQGRRCFTIKISQSVSALSRHLTQCSETIYTHTHTYCIKSNSNLAKDSMLTSSLPNVLLSLELESCILFSTAMSSSNGKKQKTPCINTAILTTPVTGVGRKSSLLFHFLCSHKCSFPIALQYPSCSLRLLPLSAFSWSCLFLSLMLVI